MKPAHEPGPDQQRAGARTVVIAVPTFRRNEELRTLLPALLAQMAAAPWTCRLVVIDNDPDAGAREVVPLGVEYHWEQQPGIAAARNRALAAAGDADALIFVDDDETPHDGWLAALLAAYERFRPGAVVGPVISTFTSPVPEFVSAGRYFARLRHPTGTVVRTAATNNLLLDLAAVRTAGLAFDERFGLSGGSDTLFTKQLVAAGHRIVWCDEAVVDDRVPDQRNSREWVTKRAYRSGNSWSRTSLAAAGTAPRRLLTRVSLSAQGLVRVIGGGLRFAVGWLTRSLAAQARGIRTFQRGAGMLTGACNVVYSEYQRPAG